MRTPKPLAATKRNLNRILKEAGFSAASWHASSRVKGWGEWFPGFKVKDFTDAETGEVLLTVEHEYGIRVRTEKTPETEAAWMKAYSDALRVKFDILNRPERLPLNSSETVQRVAIITKGSARFNHAPDGWIVTGTDGQGGVLFQVYHCCLLCGYVPVEGMEQYRAVMGHQEATCFQCGANLLALETVALATPTVYEAGTPAGIADAVGDVLNDFMREVVETFKVAQAAGPKALEAFSRKYGDTVDIERLAEALIRPDAWEGDPEPPDADEPSGYLDDDEGSRFKQNPVTGDYFHADIPDEE